MAKFLFVLVALVALPGAADSRPELANNAGQKTVENERQLNATIQFQGKLVNATLPYNVILTQIPLYLWDQ